jgi:hypothetical protein
LPWTTPGPEEIEPEGIGLNLYRPLKNFPLTIRRSSGRTVHIVIVDKIPFMLSLSKHVQPFFNSLFIIYIGAASARFCKDV